MFAGVIPILATPFGDDDSLDLSSWQRLLEFMIELGVDGVTILGVLGESNRLNDEERQTLIEAAVAVVAGACRSSSVRAPPALAPRRPFRAWREDLGADAVMVAPAKEPVPNDDRIVELYQQIAQAVSIPIVLQDHPASTDVHMPAGLIARILRSVPSIACVKEEAVPTAPKIRQLREAFAERRIPILSGLGALYAPFDLEAGSDGFNTGFAFPEVLQALVAAARAQDWPQRASDLLAICRADRVRAAARCRDPQRAAPPPRPVWHRARVRHPGATISAAQSQQLDALLARTLPDVDITRPIPSGHLARA